MYDQNHLTSQSSLIYANEAGKESAYTWPSSAAPYKRNHIF